MKRRIVATLLAMSLLVAMTPAAALGEEDLELSFSANELVQDKTENNDGSVLDNVTNQNAAIMEALGQKDWNALAEAVKLTGDWRDDLVNVAASQVGYAEASDGMTIYTTWAEEKEAVGWTALFISWVAEKAGLSSREFPRGNSYDKLRSAMNKVKAVKKITRSAYPTAGDLAFIEHNGQKLVGIVTYVSNGYASMILGDMNGRVVKEIWPVSANGFTCYGDLNVLMERAGIEVGKGGEVPFIPEGGVAAWTNTNAVYMRSEPTTASKRVTTVKKSGTALVVYSGEMQDDGYIWYAVEYGKYEGYIRGDLLNLDMAAIQAAKPVQTPIPAPKPEATVVPGCAVCANAAMGLALPEVCCYEQLKALGAQNARLLMDVLKRDDKQTYELYARCHDAHVAAGAPAIPFDSGLAVQERVVNIEVVQAEAGEAVTIAFEVYSATEYQWYAVTAAEDGSTVTTAVEGANASTLTVYAQPDDAVSYYCVATIRFNGQTIDLVSKLTKLDVGNAPIMAEAIVGEEVKFTYKAEGAAGYQWYGPVKQADGSYRVAAISGATGANYTTSADIAIYKSGLYYYCEALSSRGEVLSTSASYAYTILAGSEYIHLYINELLNMSRTERYEALNNTWYVELGEITGVAEDVDVISEQVMLTWYGMTDANGTVYLPGMQDEYPDLLCTCIGSDTVEVPNGLLLHPQAQHDTECPWYVPPVKMTSAGPSTEDTTTDLTVFYDCGAFPTECEMVSGWVTAAASPMAIYNDLIALQSQPGYTADGYEYDMYFAVLMHTAAHEGSDALLCSCVEDMYSTLLAPGANHAETCAWYMAGVDAEELASRVESEPEFSEWAETATPEMITRALKAQTLDHLVVDNGYLYVAREEQPRATVDADGYVWDIEHDIVIAQIIDGVFTPLWQIQ